MQFYISVMFLGLPEDKDEEKPSFLQFKKNALPTDRQTDQRTDKPSYRDARTHLKSGTTLPMIKRDSIRITLFFFSTPALILSLMKSGD